MEGAPDERWAGAIRGQKKIWAVAQHPSVQTSLFYFLFCINVRVSLAVCFFLDYKRCLLTHAYEHKCILRSLHLELWRVGINR